jgi:hypothetical protein
MMTTRHHSDGEVTVSKHTKFEVIKKPCSTNGTLWLQLKEAIYIENEERRPVIRGSGWSILKGESAVLPSSASPEITPEYDCAGIDFEALLPTPGGLLKLLFELELKMAKDKR